MNSLFINYRYTAIGLECGTFITFIVDLESNEVVEKLTFSFEGPLTKVIFFPTEGNRLGEANNDLRLFKLSPRDFYLWDFYGLLRYPRTMHKRCALHSPRVP